LPGHGPIIDDPTTIIDEYLRHRAEREQQILAALAAGSDTPARIVEHVYAGLAPALLPAAVESVLAHLIKLRDEGKIVEERERWRLV
jgi:hypothetical protein